MLVQLLHAQLPRMQCIADDLPGLYSACHDYIQLAVPGYFNGTSTATRWQQQAHEVLGANQHLAAGLLLTCYDRETTQTHSRVPRPQV